MEEQPKHEVIALYTDAAKEIQDFIRELGIIYTPTGSYFEEDAGFRWGVYERDIDFIEATHCQIQSRMWHRDDIEVVPSNPSDIDYNVDISHLSPEAAFLIRDRIIEKARSIYNRTHVYVHVSINMPDRE